MTRLSRVEHFLNELLNSAGNQPSRVVAEQLCRDRMQARQKLKLGEMSMYRHRPRFCNHVSARGSDENLQDDGDRFFSQYDLKSLLHGPVDLAFIDGMHHAEFVLRDFINIEKNSHAGTVIMMDDVLPDRIELTTRERMGAAVWTGDVYKVITILRQYRPDLEVGVLDVDVKGLACVTRLNSASTKLSESYDAIEKAILSGEYELKSVESIRQRANPISANQITRLLQDGDFRRQIWDIRPVSD